MRAEFVNGSQDAEVTRNQTIIEMLDRNFAVIEFDLSGTILRANDVFLKALGYTMNEIVGESHRMFVDAAYGVSNEYKLFWDTIAAGKAHAGQFPRITKSGKTIWIQATYAPVFNADGLPVSAVKIASDVTSRRVVVNRLEEGLVALGQGDLKHRIEPEANSEMNRLAEMFNSSMEKLHHVFSVVGDVASGLGQAANDMETRANSSVDSAIRAAASFEETSAEVELIAVSVNKTSENAGTAMARTDETASLADISAAAMGQALEATVEMRKSTTEMSGINDVIDSIAFQTNLLALNAGIEAARAGQSGAGFAVVATEIRNLAGRSQDASSKIQELISRSVTQAKTTENHVHDSEANIKDVQSKTRDMAERMTDISAESAEQADRVKMISDTVRDLAKSGERGALMASENQESAQSLAKFSAKLSEELHRFSVR